MPNDLDLDDLHRLSDIDVKTVVITTFISLMKNSYSVKSIFFPDAMQLSVYPKDPTFVDDVACGLICSAIAQISKYDFSKTIDTTRADKFWKAQLNSEKAVSEGQALYNWAFPDYCKSEKCTFRDYLNDSPKEWATKYADHIKSPDFMNVEILKMISGQANWLEKINLMLYKLQMLNSSVVPSVLEALMKAYPDSGIVQNFNLYNYIHYSKFDKSIFASEVINAINIEESEWSPNSTEYVSGTTYHKFGNSVNEFLQKKPTNLGITTGVRPDNVVLENYSAAGCFIAGTPILLSNGKEIPIQDICEGHLVMAKDGALSTQSEEHVVIQLDRDITIYGINDNRPFFSPGHLFWTRKGWKAIDPVIALNENPSRKIGKLVVGDVVFKISSLNPFAYDEVLIKNFTSCYLKCGEYLYGLHLHGPRSYHAHGFCVGMNYPEITVKRLTMGFSRLTEAERQLIAHQLHPIMPLLKKSIGGFIESALQRSLLASEEFWSK